MIQGHNYRVSEAGDSIRLWKIRGTMLPNKMWRIEEWKYTNENDPDSCPPDRVSDIEPQPAHALLNQLYDKSIAAQVDELAGHFLITPRLGVYLFLEGFLKPEHFVAAVEEDNHDWITVHASIREGRLENVIDIFDPIWNLKAEASLQGAVELFIPDEEGWLS